MRKHAHKIERQEKKKITFFIETGAILTDSAHLIRYNSYPDLTNDLNQKLSSKRLRETANISDWTFPKDVLQDRKVFEVENNKWNSTGTSQNV